MALVSFAGDSTPALLDLDANFSELADQLSGHKGLLSWGTRASATAALTAAAAALTGGGTVSLEAGTWTLPTPFSTAVWRLSIVGEGKNATVFSFAPGATATALKFDAGGGSGYNENSIRYIGFSGGADTSNKTAIEYVNAANCEIQGVAIATGSWLGDSIGIKASGRQLLKITDCKLACSRPLVFAQNPYFTTLCTDHFKVAYCELVGTSSSFPVVEFSDGVNFSNVTLEEVAFVKGKDGIKWLDTSSTAAGFQFIIRGGRFEQGLDPTGWCVWLESSAQVLQSVLIDGTRLDINRNGIKLRNVQRATIRNVDFAMGSGKVSLDVVMVAGGSLILENCQRQVGSTFSITNAKLVSSTPSASGVGFSEIWVFDSGYAAGELRSDAFHGGSPIVLAGAVTANLVDTSFTGFLDIFTSQDVSATICVAGTTGTVAVASDPFGTFTATNTPGNNRFNVYKVGSNYVIDNQRTGAPTVTIAVHKRGSSI